MPASGRSVANRDNSGQLARSKLLASSPFFAKLGVPVSPGDDGAWSAALLSCLAARLLGLL